VIVNMTYSRRHMRAVYGEVSHLNSLGRWMVPVVKLLRADLIKIIIF